MLNFSGLRENLASFSFLSPFKNNMSLSRVYMDAKGQQNPIVLTRTSTASQQRLCVCVCGGGEDKALLHTCCRIKSKQRCIFARFDITKTPARFLKLLQGESLGILEQVSSSLASADCHQASPGLSPSSSQKTNKQNQGRATPPISAKNASLLAA